MYRKQVNLHEMYSIFDVCIKRKKNTAFTGGHMTAAQSSIFLKDTACSDVRMTVATKIMVSSSSHGATKKINSGGYRLLLQPLPTRYIPSPSGDRLDRR